MNLRHAAALALVGWYLMVPPKKKLDAPIPERLQFAAYDTAEQCENAKAQLVDRIASGQSKLTKDQLAFSDCIASDDPRLKEPSK